MKFVGIVFAAFAATGTFVAWAPWTYADNHPKPRVVSGEVFSHRAEVVAWALEVDTRSSTNRDHSTPIEPQSHPTAGVPALQATSSEALDFTPSELFKLLPGSWLSATRVQVGDVTGDGRLDIVVLANPISGAPVGTYPKSTLYVFRQDLQGGFGAPLALAQDTFPYVDVKLGDVDNDGDVDIVASSSAGLTVYMYRPDGTFQFVYSSGGASQSLGLLDVDVDGRLDAVTRHYVWYGDGKGAFPRYETPHVMAPGHQFAVGDVTSDGRPDIVAPDNGQYLTEVVSHEQIAGGAPRRYQYEPSEYGQPPVAIGDFNHDGRKDIALAIQQEPTPFLHFRYQDATRTLGPSSTLPLPARADALVSADMNGDNRDDLVVLYGYDPMKLGVLLQTNNGFANMVSVPGLGYGAMGPEALAVGDLTNDGCPDAVAVTGDRVVLFTASGCQRTPVAINCVTQLPVNGAISASIRAAVTPRREHSRLPQIEVSTTNGTAKR